MESTRQVLEVKPGEVKVVEAKVVEAKAINQKLNPEVLKLIRDSLQHIFEDVPDEESAFKSFVADVKNAILGNLKSDHGLHGLQHFIYNLGMHFKKYITPETPINAGVLIQEILQYINIQLLKICKQSSDKLRALNWDCSVVLTEIGKKIKLNENIIAKNSVGPIMPTASDLKTDGKAYSATVMPDKTDVVVRVALLNEKGGELSFESKFLVKAPRVANTKSNQAMLDRFVDMQSENPDTHEIAARVAFVLIMNHLISPKVKRLIGFKSYYKLLEEEKIQLSDLKDLDEELFSHPYVQSIVVDKESLLKAKELKLPEVKVLNDPLFVRKLEEGKLNFENDIKGITEEQRQNLFFTPAYNLYALGKISFKTLKDILPKTKELLSEATYYEMIKLGTLRYGQIKKIQRRKCEFMLNPKILALLAKNILPVDKALKLSRTERKKILDSVVYELLLRGVVNIDQALQINPAKISALQKQPYLLKMVIDGSFVLDEVDPTSVPFWVEFFSNRIAAIQKEASFFYGNVFDHFELVLKDIAQVAEDFHIPMLLGFVHKAILLGIKASIVAEQHRPKFYNDILVLIDHAEKTSTEQSCESCSAAFTGIIALSKMQLSQLPKVFYLEPALKRQKTNLVMFSKPASLIDTMGMKMFCEKLLELETLIPGHAHVSTVEFEPGASGSLKRKLGS